jgi:hypothetical protein
LRYCSFYLIEIFFGQFRVSIFFHVFHLPSFLGRYSSTSSSSPRSPISSK